MHTKSNISLTHCVCGSDNARHHAYVHGVHKGANPRHKTHFKSVIKHTSKTANAIWQWAKIGS